MLAAPQDSKELRDSIRMHTSPRYAPWRRGLFLGSQALLILVLTGLLTEGAFRLVQQVQPSFIFPEVSYGRFRPPPGTEIFGYPLNSQGFQDVERQYDKNEGDYRILGIGDSFVFGIVPRPANFLTLLERDLLDDGESVEIVNMGIPRTGVTDYRSLLLNEGLKYDPDLVLVFFYMGNDFLLPKPTVHRSYLFSFLHYVFRIWPRHGGQLQVADEYRDDARSFRSQAYLNVRGRQLGQFRSEQPRYRLVLDRLATALTDMQKFCNSVDASMAVVLIPDEMQVYDDLRQRIARGKDHTYDVEQPRLDMLAALADRGITTIDLLPAFRSANDESLYKPQDTHWNLRGNQLAAEDLRRQLDEGGWLNER